MQQSDHNEMPKLDSQAYLRPHYNNLYSLILVTSKIEIPDVANVGIEPTQKVIEVSSRRSNNSSNSLLFYRK